MAVWSSAATPRRSSTLLLLLRLLCHDHQRNLVPLGAQRWTGCLFAARLVPSGMERALRPLRGGFCGGAGILTTTRVPLPRALATSTEPPTPAARSTIERRPRCPG